MMMMMMTLHGRCKYHDRLKHFFLFFGWAKKFTFAHVSDHIALFNACVSVLVYMRVYKINKYGYLAGSSLHLPYSI